MTHFIVALEGMGVEGGGVEGVRKDESTSRYLPITKGKRERGKSSEREEGGGRGREKEKQ